MKQLLLCALCLAWCVSCGSERGAMQQEEKGTLAAFKGASYGRSGGLAGANDTITITADGQVKTTGKFFGERSTRLSDFQRMQLARLFEGWEKLKDNYPAPPRSADTQQITIEYEGKKVTASDASPDVPIEFKRVQARLESMARDLAAQR